MTRPDVLAHLQSAKPECFRPDVQRLATFFAPLRDFQTRSLAQTDGNGVLRSSHSSKRRVIIKPSYGAKYAPNLFGSIQ